MRVLLLLGCLTAAAAIEPLAIGDGGFVTPGGEPVGLFGVNLAESHQRWARWQRPREVAETFARLARYEFNLVRVPLQAGLLMPAPGVLPDEPRYAAELARYNLDAGYPALLDHLVAEAARHEIWCLLELHEYPIDPSRWVTGGDETSGGGMHWAADPALLRTETPAILGWLAARYQGNPALAGIEIPHLSAGDDALIAHCATAVKAADPRRLVFLNVGDGVAARDRLGWDLPQIDALAPRFAFGSTTAAAYGVAPASWLSWWRGSGKPVVVAEYGPAAVAPEDRSAHPSGRTAPRLDDACLAGWLRNGAAGVARWAWDGGLGAGTTKTGAIEGEALELLKYRRPYQLTPRPNRGQVAIVLNPARRSPDGRPGDLLRIAATLLDAGIAPFDCVFAPQAITSPEVLGEYPAVLVYLPDLDPAARAAVAGTGVPRLELADDAIDPARLRAWLREQGLRPDPTPIAVWDFATPGYLALYNRTAGSAAYAVQVPADRRLVDLLSGETLPGSRQHVRVDLTGWTGRDLALLGVGEPLPAPRRGEAGRARANEGLPLVIGLYDHGPLRGRWVDGWAGGRALLRQDAEGREVIAVSTTERQAAGGFTLNRRQPAELRSWRRTDGAALELKVRLTSRNVAAVEIELHGEGGVAVTTAALRPGTEWQRLRLPLDRFNPTGRPDLLTGIYLRFLPAGSGEIGGAWLTRSPDREPG